MKRKNSDKLQKKNNPDIEEESINGLILDSLKFNICLLNERGEIEQVNKSWLDFAKENDADPEEVSLGANYLKACEMAEGEDKEIALKFRDGIKAVIEGAKEYFELEYPCHSPESERWFLGRVVPCNSFTFESKRKVVIYHENITARKLAEKRELLEREEKQKAKEELSIKEKTIESSINAIALTDFKGRLTYVNPSFLQLIGYEKEEEILGKSLHDFWVEQSKGEEMLNTLLEEGTWDGELAFKRKDGSLLEANLTASIIYGEDSPVITLMASFIDITDRKMTERYLIRFRNALDSSADSIFIIDYPSYNFLDVNKTACLDLGYSKDELMELTPFDIIASMSKEKLKEKFNSIIGNYPFNVEEYPEREGVESFEAYLIKKNKNTYPVEISLRYSDIPGEEWFVAAVRDISERKQTEERLRYLSYHDSVTGLYNRSYLEDEIKRLDSDEYLPVSIIMADVNGLKLVNDTYGHQVGDKLLKRTAQVLSDSCRKDDVVARWGGDEFVIFLPNTSKEEASEVVKSIREKSDNFYVNSIPVKIALGSATKEDSDEQFLEAFKRAEDRMYQTKLTETNSARSDIILALLGTLKEKSDETEEHAWRLTELGFAFGEMLGLCDEDLDKLSLLATMHDIGKVVISEEILKKPGKLTEKEWEKIKEHPETGQRIARTSENLIYIAEEILCHHERWDGKGYPNGLEGENIPYLARIIAILDAYDVMTEGRSYKKAMTREKALEEIEKNAGTQFDPELAKLFVKMMKSHKTDSDTD